MSKLFIISMTIILVIFATADLIMINHHNKLIRQEMIKGYLIIIELQTELKNFDKVKELKKELNEYLKH